MSIIAINPQKYQNKSQINQQINAIIKEVDDKTITNMCLKQVGLTDIKYLKPILDALNRYMPKTEQNLMRKELNQAFYEYAIKHKRPNEKYYCKTTPNLVGNPNLIHQQAISDIKMDVIYPTTDDIKSFIEAINQMSSN